MPLPHRFLKLVRTGHLYMGVFAAPMLLFFAITGGLQTFSLHETQRGSDYAPPAWLVSMAQLHKKQTLEVRKRTRPPQAAVTTTEAASAKLASKSDSGAEITADPRTMIKRESERPRKNLLPMKIFFAVVAISLLLSVLTGLYMAWRFSRRPALFSGVLLAGVVVPLLLMLF